VIPEKIDTLKDLHLTTDLREAVVVAPDDPAWQAAAERLRVVLSEAAGTGVPVVDAAGTGLDGLGSHHQVLLGSAHCNPVIMALYRRQYAFVDDFYPGGDGYVLRTVHNPQNQGHNALLVGASRPEGAGPAIDELGSLLGAGGPVLRYTNQSRSHTHAPLLPRCTPAQFQEQIEAAFRGNAGRGPIERGVTLGLAHHLTGDADSARMFGDVLLYYDDLVRSRYSGEWCFEHMLFIYAWVWRLAYTWDLIEESDAFGDTERLRITNLLWGLTQYVAALPYFAGEPPPLEIRQNHWTFAALSMSLSAGYFRTYYGIDPFSRQLTMCEGIFDGQAESYKANDDAGGGGYCWLVPEHQMIHDLRRDDLRFLDGGHLRDLADYAILITDNLASTVNFGDCGMYAQRRSASAGIAGTLCRAAWHYGEGSYLWALDWMGGRIAHGCLYRDLPRLRPEHLEGISVAPLNRDLYRWVADHGPGGANVPLAEAFDKLCLRGGFEEDDLYLLLDGTSTFAHGHDDGNSVERLTWHGRMWLAETDYIWRRPRHHSSVVAICDGESGDMPSLTALKWAEDFGDTVFTRTTVPGYNGADWVRDLFWVKDGFLLVADSLHLREEADYDLQCLWRVLGDTDLQGATLAASQQGVSFRIWCADGSDTSLSAEEPRVTGLDPYAPYEYADGPTWILEQRRTCHGSPGDVVHFHSLMATGAAADVQGGGITRIADGVVRADLAGDRWVFGVDETGELAAMGDIRVRARAFALSPETVAFLEATEVSMGQISLSSDAPVHLWLSPADGTGELRLREEGAVSLRGLPGLRVGEQSASGEVKLGPGAHELAFAGASLDLSGAVDGRPAPDHGPALRPKQNRFVTPAEPGMRPMWEVRTEGAVRCLDGGRRGGESVFAAGTAAREVLALSPDGCVLWQRELGAEVRTVCATGLGRAAVVAGGCDCALTALSADGEQCWRREFGISHGRDQIVNCVEVADLLGTGQQTIVAATDGWLVWALDPAGEELWQRQIEHHAARSLVIGDVEGDGRQEILVGTEYYNSNLLEADGQIRWTIRGGPSFTALALCDLDGDGVLESVYGSMDGNVYAVDSNTGQIRWRANLGDDVDCGVAIHAATGWELVAGSRSGNVAGLGPDGQRRWRRDLESPVTGLISLSWPGVGETIAVGTANGWLVLLSPEGEITGGMRLESGVTCLQACDPEDGPRLLVGTAGGAIRAFGADAPVEAR